MSALKVLWEEGALKLLERRDRYTRNLIRDEFRRNLEAPDPGATAIELDTDQFLTPVSDSRFSVVWRREHNQAVVRGVVPLTHVPRFAKIEPAELAEFKEYVRRALEAESQGEIPE